MRVMWVEIERRVRGISEILPPAVAKRIAQALKIEYGAKKRVFLVKDGKVESEQ